MIILNAGKVTKDRGIKLLDELNELLTKKKIDKKQVVFKVSTPCDDRVYDHAFSYGIPMTFEISSISDIKYVLSKVTPFVCIDMDDQKKTQIILSIPRFYNLILTIDKNDKIQLSNITVSDIVIPILRSQHTVKQYEDAYKEVLLLPEEQVQKKMFVPIFDNTASTELYTKYEPKIYEKMFRLKSEEPNFDISVKELEGILWY